MNLFKTGILFVKNPKLEPIPDKRPKHYSAADFIIPLVSYSVLLQVLYFAISHASGGSGQSRGHGLADLPSDVIAIVLVWPLLALFISELLKRRYIK